MTNEAHYRCLGCSFEWQQKPAVVRCPNCNDTQVLWINYEEWRKRDEQEVVPS